MKIAVVIFFLLFAGAVIFGILKQDYSTTEVSVLRDITDKHTAEPVAEEILLLFNFSVGEKWNGAIFRFSSLSDVSYNPTAEIKLEAKNKWLSNEIERGKEIKKFTGGTSQILSDSSSQPIGKRYSAIYFPIAKELKRLRQSKSQSKILLIYSDLMQNDFDVSLYSKSQIELLQTNPDSLKQSFEKQEQLPSLAGIEIYFIYQPMNAEDDRQYRIVSEFYKNLFEEKGATVNITANLTN